ncbi:Telomere repeat-binding protein 5 [Camellia lanceoleosa]|uniref:Telomere repeat-binding protein 5 n=1 Tax=Camellia lanceoleosa TaxID=1840588 RepID=A0ACC0HVQ8_9ERIC|nr:Telomere repeat-binding protein 5 [Camellia lanceoleosa]
MVLQKRLDYGFNGYQVPPTTRPTRSARRRVPFRKSVDDNQMYAFDLLATVASKLLLEGENSPSSGNALTGKELCTIVKDSFKKEQKDEDNPSKAEPYDRGSCDRSFSFSELASHAPALHHSLKEFSHAHIDDCWGLASVITTSDCSEKVGSAEKLKSKFQLGSSTRKLEVASSGYQESCDFTAGNENKKQTKIESPKAGNALNVTRANICSSDDLAVRDRKPPALVSVNNRVKLPSCIDQIPSSSFPACRDDIKLVIRDDDENSSGCSQPSTITKTFRSPLCIGNRRIRKFFSSKYWKVTPKLKDKEHFNADSKIKPVYYNRKICYKRRRSQRDYPFKKRRLYDPSGISACVAGQHTSFQSRDSHVKLRIKSFKVPKLVIEIPESATVGSLKGTVMDAVTAILGGGLRVGVLLQGKKIRDDNKTLLQTGISHNNKLDALGFFLEPNPSQAPQSLCHEDRPFLLACDIPQPLTRYPPAPSVVHNVVQQRTADTLPDPLLSSLGNFIERDHDSAPSPLDIDRSLSWRRIRRPFSVYEVEALVQAVEKLGTGSLFVCSANGVRLNCELLIMQNIELMWISR